MSGQSDKPIGVFDSGVGGLTVAKELFRVLPAESVVYFGDVGRAPYGGRSKEIIAEFARQDVAFLLEQEVKYIVCACNTVSAVALEQIQQSAGVPIIGVIEPGAQAALARTANGRIGVIGTHATINSNAYAATIARLDAKVKVFSLACPLFVPLVEEGYQDKEASILIARDYLKTMQDVGVDTLILGCTHYPLLKQVIGTVMGNGVSLIDSGEETARVARDLMISQRLIAEDRSRAEGARRFFVSDVPEKFSQVATRFLEQPVDRITRVDISRY